MNWLNYKRRKNRFGDTDTCYTCPSNTSNFSPGCVSSIDGFPNWCSLMNDKFDYASCDTTYPSANDPVENFLCRVGTFFEGVGLTIIQYGTLPAIIFGTAVAAGYIKSAES